MPVSCGLLMYRRRKGAWFVLLIHPGGPYWRKRDAGAWSIPKGGPNPGEDLLAAAKREFTEETGFIARGPFAPLAPCRQAGGKLVHCWAFRGDADPAKLRSVTFEMEWPPRSGRRAAFPEADRAAWFTPAEAMIKLLPAQRDFIRQLEQLLARAR